MSKETNALVPVKDYAVVGTDPAELMETIRTNVGGDIGTFDLERISIPTGGSTTWEYETIDGAKTDKALTGVIVGIRDARAYWAKGGDDAQLGEQPDCRSDDGLMGIGDPGGVCASCPLAQFGSARDGRGQACKSGKLVLLMLPHARLPYLVVIPPASLKAFRKYLLRLSSAGVRYYSVVTQLGLEKRTNPDSKPYAEVVPQVGPALTDDQRAHFEALGEGLAPIFEKATLAPEPAEEAPAQPQETVGEEEVPY